MARLCALPSNAMERKPKLSSCDKTVRVFSTCLDFTHRGCAGAAHSMPTEGWETRRSWQVHSNCAEGHWFQVLTTQAHMQTGQCNRDVCFVSCFACMFFSSLISALEAFDIRRVKILKSSAAWHWECYSPSAFSRYVLASLILEAGANMKCILPHKSLTTCAAKHNA